MTKETNQKLNKSTLSAYATMGAAFLAATPQTADAQIIHVDPPDITVTTTGGPGAGLQTDLLFIDLDGNTTSPTASAGADIGIYHYVYPPTGGSLWATARNVVFGSNGGVVSNGITSGAINFYANNNLAAGDNICAGPGVSSYGNGGVLYNHRYYSAAGGTFRSTGNFTPANTPVSGYLGVQFQIAGATHYGWVRVTSTVNAGPPSVQNPVATTVIHEWAYEATPDACLAAGQLPPAPVAPVAPIPTLSEWGLITLSLLLLSFGTVLVGKREEILAGEKGGNYKISGLLQKPPFYAKYFRKALIGTAMLAAIMGAFSIIAYGGITAVDFFGTLVAGPIFAYLMHLVAVYNDEFNANKGNK